VQELNAANMEFQLVSQGAGLDPDRYERGSLLVTTNLDFSRWVEVFGDATLTAALLDRLTHHAQILLFQSESDRFRESHQHHREV
jgi:DNA replication protein DnaC